MHPSILVVIAMSALPMAFGAGSASAQFFEGQSVLFGRYRTYEGAWCAVTDTGAGRVEENCAFDSFDACRREAGLDRGFCRQNPAYAGPPPPPPPSRKKGRHRG